MSGPDFPLPLYVGRHAHVALDDGPSLVVANAGYADLRTPLSRCARVVLHETADIEADALRACVRHRIPLVWRSEDGLPQAMCLPACPDPMAWRELVLDALARSAWDARYDAWLSAQRRIALLSLGRRFGFSVCGWREEPWLRALFMHFRLRQAWSFWALRQWRGMLTALVLRHWMEQSYPPEAFQCRARGWNLAGDIAACVALDMVDVLVRHASDWRRVRRGTPAQVECALIEALERRRKRLERLIDAMHGRFLRWLLDWREWE